MHSELSCDSQIWLIKALFGYIYNSGRDLKKWMGLVLDILQNYQDLILIHSVGKWAKTINNINQSKSSIIIFPISYWIIRKTVF